MSEPTMLEQLLDAMEQCKTLIRQAHEATSDLRQATREAREVGRELQRDEFEPWMRKQVEERAADLAEAVGDQTRKSRADVMASFQRLSNLLMYGNEQGRGDSLEPRIRKVAQKRHANGDANGDGS